MRKNLFLVAIAALVVCSCGSSKKTTTVPDYNNRETAAGFENTSAYNQMNKTEVQLNDCQKAEMMEEENMRAARSVITYDQGEGKTMAEEEARTLLATRLQTAVENAVKSYNKNVSVNQALSEERIRQRINKQFCTETVGGLKIVAQNVYALPNGSLEVWVCYEMKKTKQQAVTEIIKEVTSDQEVKVLADQKMFENDITEELNAYKNSVSNENK